MHCVLIKSSLKVLYGQSACGKTPFCEKFSYACEILSKGLETVQLFNLKHEIFERKNMSVLTQTRTRAKCRFTHVYHMIRSIAFVPECTYSKRDCNCINRTLSPTTWVFHLVLGLLSIYASNKKGQ